MEPCLQPEFDSRDAPVRVEIRRGILGRNCEVLRDLCAGHGLQIAGVTKGVSGHPEVARIMVSAGLPALADARLANIRRMRRAGITAPIQLLRPPGLGEAADAVRLADAIFVTNPTTLQALAWHGRALGRRARIVLMVDLGDLREGAPPTQLLEIAALAQGLEGLTIAGLGTNFACLSGLLPTRENLSVFADLARQIEARTGRRLDILSGGNSASLLSMQRGDFPPEINQLRLGESLLLGFEASEGAAIEGTSDAGFSLVAEVLETWQRETDVPGPRTRNALGHAVTLDVTGCRRLAVAGIGAIDTDIAGLVPSDPRLRKLGYSSDHTVLDVTDAPEIRPGDRLRFAMNYTAVSKAMSAPDLTVATLD